MGIVELIFPSCKTLAERLSRGEYERAPLAVRLAARWHLWRCALCDKYARQLDAIGKGYSDAARKKVEPESAALTSRLLKKLR